MCVTLPRVLISVMGIEKVLPRWQDMEAFLQLLPRSSTAERMNPYNSVWTGTRAGEGPQEFHLVLLDNGRTNVLADPATRETLACIRCSACLNVCPVYERTGGHAYGSTYPGPIGAILTPQLNPPGPAESLPWASSLCGACYEVCPVKINIPRILVYLRGKVTERRKETWAGRLDPEALAMAVMGRIFRSPRLFAWAQRAAALGQLPFIRQGTIRHLPGPLSGWTAMRDLAPVPKESFRDWWRKERS
jgi:L-lactate dehydrogenase complex protein LldF